MPAVPLIREIAPGQLVLLEFQGRLESSAGNLDKTELGELELVSAVSASSPLDSVANCANMQDEAVFTTRGNQQLRGRLVPLKKPLAVVEPIAVREEESLGVADPSPPSRHLRIVSIITSKYLFDTRPSIVIANKSVRASS